MFPERVGEVVGGAGDDDGIEGGVFGPAAVPIAGAGVDGVIPFGFEIARGHAGEGFDNFDGVDGGGEMRENGGLVAGAAADFEDLPARGQAKVLGHEGDDVGL